MLELKKEYTYKQICEELGWDIVTGNSKIAQIKELEASYDYYHPINKKTHKEKKSYIFTRHIKEPVKPSKKNSGGAHNTARIQPMMNWLMMKVTPGDAYISMTAWLCKELDLLNLEVCSMIYHEWKEIEEYCKDNEITNTQLFKDYVSAVKKITKGMFNGALDALTKQEKAICRRGYTFTFIHGAISYDSFSTDKFNEIIKKNETKICDWMQQKHKLSNKMQGRQLLFMIYGDKQLQEEYKEEKVNAAMHSEQIYKHMNDMYEDAEECTITNYYESIAVEQIDSKPLDEDIVRQLSNEIRLRTRKELFNKHYTNKNGCRVYIYDKFECLEDIYTIEKLLFKHYATDLKDEYSLNEEDMQELETLFN